MNALFKEYKKQVDECKVVLVDEIETPYKVYPTVFIFDEKRKYDRAKKKQEDKEMIKEWEEEQL